MQTSALNFGAFRESDKLAASSTPGGMATVAETTVQCSSTITVRSTERKKFTNQNLHTHDAAVRTLTALPF